VSESWLNACLEEGGIVDVANFSLDGRHRPGGDFDDDGSWETGHNGPVGPEPSHKQFSVQVLSSAGQTSSVGMAELAAAVTGRPFPFKQSATPRADASGESAGGRLELPPPRQRRPAVHVQNCAARPSVRIRVPYTHSAMYRGVLRLHGYVL
jgi:hypothetical protein